MRPFAAAVALALPTSQSACLFRARPDSFRYFTLASSAEPPVQSASGLTVGLGPVTLPGYLSRPSLVTRANDTQVRYAEGELWAEPLGEQFTRTLREDLSQEAGEENFFLFGLTAEQVANSRAWYSPWWHYEHEPETRAAHDLVFADHFNPSEGGAFEPLREALLTHGDHFMHLADHRAYLDATDRRALRRPRRLGADGDPQRRGVGQVLQRPDHRRVRGRDLGREALHRDVATTTQSTR